MVWQLLSANVVLVLALAVLMQLYNMLMQLYNTACHHKSLEQHFVLPKRS